MDKAEFMRQWGVTGMPLDKIKLANAAWDAAILAEREECAALAENFIWWEVHGCSDDEANVFIAKYIRAR